MFKYLLIFSFVLYIFALLSACSDESEMESSHKNLINKVNPVENQWIDYSGTVETDNNMMKSQFIPYNSNEDYIVNNDVYVTYYKGEDFITTELHDAETELENVADADGVILSFNKGNKNGMKLINKD